MSTINLNERLRQNNKKGSMSTINLSTNPLNYYTYMDQYGVHTGYCTPNPVMDKESRLSRFFAAR